MSTGRIVSCDSDAAPSRDVAIGVIILSDVRFVRDALVAIFERSDKLDILGAAAEFGVTFRQNLVRDPDIVLIDVNLPDGFATVRLIRRLAPQVRVVALALVEREDEVIAWAEAGVSGYIPRSAGLNEVVPILEGAMRDEQICSPRVASGLVRRLAVASSRERPAEPVELTRRELEIVQLINEGLSNKEIANHLKIGLATAKSHVHNVLGKLGLGRRSQAAQWMREHARTAALR